MESGNQTPMVERHQTRADQVVTMARRHAEEIRASAEEEAERVLLEAEREAARRHEERARQAEELRITAEREAQRVVLEAEREAARRHEEQARQAEELRVTAEQEAQRVVREAEREAARRREERLEAERRELTQDTDPSSSDAWQRLRELVTECKQRNQRNGTLLKARAETVRIALKTLCGSDPDLYSPTGRAPARADARKLGTA